MCTCVRTYVHAVSVKHDVHDAHAVPDVPCVHDAPDVSDTYVCHDGHDVHDEGAWTCAVPTFVERSEVACLHLRKYDFVFLQTSYQEYLLKAKCPNALNCSWLKPQVFPKSRTAFQ